MILVKTEVSEGLDFADHAGRAVVITGMPFAMRTDPKGLGYLCARAWFESFSIQSTSPAIILLTLLWNRTRTCKYGCLDCSSFGMLS
ncbi:hypothetical protein CsSME_00052300 [Camellia sinensis var. sinensis]